MSKQNRRKNTNATTNKKGQTKLDIKVKCDKCGKEFYPVIKELTILKGCVIVSGFTCKCGAEYVTTVTDNHLRRDLCRLKDLQNEFSRVQRQITNEINEFKRLKGFVPEEVQVRNDNRANKYMQEITELKAITNKRGEWLKQQYNLKYSH